MANCIGTTWSAVSAARRARAIATARSNARREKSEKSIGQSTCVIRTMANLRQFSREPVRSCRAVGSGTTAIPLSTLTLRAPRDRGRPSSSQSSNACAAPLARTGPESRRVGQPMRIFPHLPRESPREGRATNLTGGEGGGPAKRPPRPSRWSCFAQHRSARAQARRVCRLHRSSEHRLASRGGLGGLQKGRLSMETVPWSSTRRLRARRAASPTRSHRRSASRGSSAKRATSPVAVPVDWVNVASVVLGAPIYAGRHQKIAVDFATSEAGHLSVRPSAWCSVSLSAGSRNPAEVDAAHALAKGFLLGRPLAASPPRMLCGKTCVHALRVRQTPDHALHRLARGCADRRAPRLRVHRLDGRAPVCAGCRRGCPAGPAARANPTGKCDPPTEHGAGPSVVLAGPSTGSGQGKFPP